MILTTWFLLFFAIATVLALALALGSRRRRINVERRQARSLLMALDNWFLKEHESGQLQIRET